MLPILLQVPEKDQDSSLLPKGGEEGASDSRDGKEGKRAVIVTFRVSTSEAQVDTVPANMTIVLCDNFPHSSCAAQSPQKGRHCIAACTHSHVNPHCMQHLTGIAEGWQLSQPAVALRSTQKQSDSLCLCHVQLPNLLRDAKFRQVLADNLKQQGISVSSIADEEIFRVRTLPHLAVPGVMLSDCLHYDMIGNC